MRARTLTSAIGNITKRKKKECAPPRTAREKKCVCTRTYVGEREQRVKLRGALHGGGPRGAVAAKALEDLAERTPHSSFLRRRPPPLESWRRPLGRTREKKKKKERK